MSGGPIQVPISDSRMVKTFATGQFVCFAGQIFSADWDEESKVHNQCHSLHEQFVTVFILSVSTGLDIFNFFHCSLIH